MGRGELIVKFTDADGSTRRIEYSNYLEALAYPCADTKILLFEEGDYDVHLNYAVQDKDGINSTTYYRASFSFKIRNGNCMVYLFDSKNSNTELTNGSTTYNGFRIDTALSKYPKIMVKKEVLNSNGDELDIRFNRAATDGEVFTDEGVYTITNVNRSNSDLSTQKMIYVGSNEILKAYTKNVDKSGKPTITIEQINKRLDEGWKISDDGDFKSPESGKTTVPVITTTTVVTTEAVTSTKATAAQATESVAESTENKSSPLVPISCGMIILAAIGGGVGY